MRVTYNGPLDAVELPDLYQVVVKRGESIEVSDQLGARLIEQRCWDASPEVIAAWVGDDQDRAATLLQAERDGALRIDVIARLELIVNPAPDEIPDGTAEEVLAWVGDDLVRATRAQVAELAGKNRAGLISRLERIIGKEAD